MLNVSYAKRNGISVGDTIKLKGKKFTVVGLAQSPLGGQASDAYVKLGQLQALSDRKGRVNTVQVRAKSTSDVAAVEKRITATLSGASVTTASDLADRVGGSLADAKDLSGKLGTALTVVGLAAAFLIASLLTLSSVTKRIRELGTLKAIGWRRAPRRAPGDRRVGRAGRARRRLRSADRDRRRGARLGAGTDARGERGAPRPALARAPGPAVAPSSGSARRRSPPAAST